MQRIRFLFPLLLIGSVVAACGEDSGEALLAGSLTGEYHGRTFTPTFGVSVDRMGKPVVALSDEGIDCSSPEDTEPPGGSSAAMFLESWEVGTYSAVLVNLYQNIDGFEGRGSNRGTLNITKSTAESLAATISYQDTDDEGGTYKLEGDFEVIRCASE